MKHFLTQIFDTFCEEEIISKNKLGPILFFFLQQLDLVETWQWGIVTLIFGIRKQKKMNKLMELTTYGTLFAKRVYKQIRNPCTVSFLIESTSWGGGGDLIGSPRLFPFCFLNYVITSPA